MLRVKGYTVCFIISMVMLGSIVLLHATKWGIGIAPDSIMYIGAARNLAEGRGFTEPSESGKNIPITHWPPFYPLILAAFGKFGIDPVIGAKVVGIFLFIANMLFVALMIRRCSGNLFLLPVYGALLMLSSVTMLSLHSMALTEPLFIFLGLIGLFLLSIYMEGSNRLFLLYASVATGLAFLTRYPGVVLVGTGMIGLLCLGRKTFPQKAMDALLFGFLSCLPIGFWVIRNVRIAGTTTNRSMVFHPITIKHINHVLFTLSGWLLPPSVPNIIRNIVLLLFLAGSIISGFLLLRQQQKKIPNKERSRHSTNTKAASAFLQQQKKIPEKERSITNELIRMPPFMGLLLIFAPVYLLFLAVSVSFFDAHTALNNRILSPLFVAVLILTLCLLDKLWHYWSAKRGNALKAFCMLICLALLASYCFHGMAWIVDAHDQGQGYATKAWHDSEVIEHIKTLPPDAPIFSNAHDAIYFLTGRAASIIPSKVFTSTNQINRACMSELADMWKTISMRRGVLVYFYTENRWYLPTEEEIKRLMPLRVLFKRADGIIYGPDLNLSK